MRRPKRIGWDDPYPEPIKSRSGNEDLRPRGPERQLKSGKWIDCRHYVPPVLDKRGDLVSPTVILGPGPHEHDA